MNSLIFAGVVIAGAITLMIEAYRNYNSSLTSIPFKEHPILQNVEVAKLCTPREKNIGFLFYSLLYLVTYVVVLSSTEIYELVAQAAASNSEIGPTDDIIGTNQDPLNLLNTQYGKPIFISAAIISIFSIGALRPVESTMRSLAHRLAGVPRGVYAVIEELHAIPFETFDVACQKPLSDMFLENADATFKASYDKSQIPSILSSLRTIDYLAPAITGKQRIQHFPFSQLSTMSELSTRLEYDVENLKDLLKVKLPDDAAERKKLFDTANAVANDTIALFAVHFLRNNRAIKNMDEKSAISIINERIKRTYRVEMNSFAMGLLFSLMAVPAAYAVILTWNVAASPISPRLAQADVRESIQLRQMPIGFETRCTLSASDSLPFDRYDAERWGLDPGRTIPDGADPADYVPFDLNRGTDRDDIAQAPQDSDAAKQAGLDRSERAAARSCAAIWRSVIKTQSAERRQSILALSFWWCVAVFFATALAAVTAIFGREVRKEDNSWPDWELRRIPFLRLFSMAVIPAIMAVLGVFIGSFLEFYVKTGFDATENQIQFFLNSKWAFFVMHAGVGFLVAIAVLILTDQHDQLNAAWTIVIGLIFSVLIVGWYYLTIVASYPPTFIRPTPDNFPFNFEMREALVYAVQPFFFILFFAVFLEVTEESAAEKRKRKRAQTRGTKAATT
ncbi:hypothetical protein [uncultured Tateyamaria sp.]|uniref:hypothetical protein n=1 Tax=uncultured Tateyamaria sp. TaxID=455651 RepID=UPI00261530A6|nr:hypothetical protein [uncultured Tateyamaria sp.]